MTGERGTHEDAQQARERLLETVRSGGWERVPAQVDAYGAAVRADERRKVVDACLDALRDVFEQDQINGLSAEGRDKLVAAVERLH